MPRTWRLAAVVVAAIAGCAWAIVTLQGHMAVDVSSCGSAPRQVPGYAVTETTEPSPPRMAGSEVVVLLRHDGAPVQGAEVCLSTDMVGMPMGGGAKHQGEELSPGRYAVFVTFGMSGTWDGNLVVSVAGRPVVSQRVSFHVG